MGSTYKYKDPLTKKSSGRKRLPDDKKKVTQSVCLNKKTVAWCMKYAEEFEINFTKVIELALKYYFGLNQERKLRLLKIANLNYVQMKRAIKNKIDKDLKEFSDGHQDN